jgi:hypothetical protein
MPFENGLIFKQLNPVSGGICEISEPRTPKKN